MGLKLLVDGNDSANLVSEYSLGGNPKGDTNFFSQDFSNHPIPAGKVNTIKTLLEKKFATATHLISLVGISNLANINEDGSEEPNPVFPFSLRFVPNRDVVTNNTSANYMTQLSGVPADITIYSIYAYDKPKELGGTETHIADMKLVGKLTPSKWGDGFMFFRHQKMDEDLAIHPEWTPYCPRF